MNCPRCIQALSHFTGLKLLTSNPAPEAIELIHFIGAKCFPPQVFREEVSLVLRHGVHIHAHHPFLGRKTQGERIEIRADLGPGRQVQVTFQQSDEPVCSNILLDFLRQRVLPAAGINDDGV